MSTAALALAVLLAHTIAPGPVPGPVTAQAAPPRARVELAGPLADVVLDSGAAGATRLAGAVAAGEVRRLDVPLALDARLVPPAVSARTGDPARVAVAARDAPEPSLHAALVRRSRPPVGARAARPSSAGLLVVAAALAVAWAARARPGVSVGASLVAAAGAAFLPPLRAGGAEVVRVYEVDGRAAAAPSSAPGRWVVVQSAAEEVALVPVTPFALELAPPDARVEWTVALDAPAPRWRAAAPGARLTVLVDHDPGARRLERELNGWASLAEAWVRDRAGRWSARGAWPLGAPLPPAGPGAGADEGVVASAPPGWLAGVLPPGLEVLLARVQPGRAPAVAGLEAPGEAWLRWVEPGLVGPIGPPAEPGRGNAGGQRDAGGESDPDGD